MKRTVYLNQFKYNTIILLLVCGIISIILKDFTAAAIIILTVILNTAMGFACAYEGGSDMEKFPASLPEILVTQGEKPYEDNTVCGNPIKLEKYILYAVLIICGFMTLLTIIRKQDLFTIFNLNINFILAAIPTGLPLAAAVSLAAGTQKTAKKNISVRKIQAVEKLGHADIICIDITYFDKKSGLMENKEEAENFINIKMHEIIELIDRCNAAGIKTCMFTSENFTASKGSALAGSDIEHMNESKLKKAVSETAVYSKVTPAQKAKIIRLLKNEGYTCIMAGCEQEDIPALKEADVGITSADDITGVTGAADIILTDDNFSRIPDLIKEGKIIISHMKKYLKYFLTCNVCETVLLLAAALLSLPMPLLPVHILWINLAASAFAAIALGFEPPESDIMETYTGKSAENTFSGKLLDEVLIRGILTGISAFIVFISVYNFKGSLAEARTAVFALLVLFQLIYIFECKNEKYDIFQINIFKNKFILGAGAVTAVLTAFILYIPGLGDILKTYPLQKQDWFILSGFVFFSLYFSRLEEFIKRLFKKKKERTIRLY